MKLIIIFFTVINFPVFLYSQGIPRIPLDTIRIHPHPDSFYARVIVRIKILPKESPKYEIFKTVCFDCDTSQIKSIHSLALISAKTKEKLHSGPWGAYYLYPCLFSLPKTKPKR